MNIDPKSHIISTTLIDGRPHEWKIVYCPGKEGGCITYEEVGCACACFPCMEGDHYDCQFTENPNSDIGPGCSLRVMDECGLQDWLDNTGSDMIQGEVTFFMRAKHSWPGDYPVLEIGSN